MEEKNEQILISTQSIFNGHSIKGNFDVQIKFKISQEEIINSIKFCTSLGRQIKLCAVTQTNSKLKLGEFTIHSIKFDRDGECTIVFKSCIDSVFVENLAILAKEEELITLKSKIVL